MGKLGNMATGGTMQWPLGPRSSAILPGAIRISNRKSGIRTRPKPQGINTIQISNRKYSHVFSPCFDRFRRRRSDQDRRPERPKGVEGSFLIYGSAIKTPRNTFKRNTYEFLIGGKPGVVTPLTTSHSPLATAFRYSAVPMLDLGYVREHLDVIEKMARDRGVALDLAAFRELDAERRIVITQNERLKAERNKASADLGMLKKLGYSAGAILSGQISLDEIQNLEPIARERLRRLLATSLEIPVNDKRIDLLDEQLRNFLLTIPNIPHASVPVGHSAAENVEVRRWGAPPKFDFAPKPHWEIGEGAGILDFDSAIKIAGSRFAVYKGLGARLERALANFFLDVHTREHGFTEVLPPFLVNSASLTADGKLPKFESEMFRIENTDLWLSPTSETQLTSLYRDETLDVDALPIKLCAWTACFRSEAGAAGKDTRGIKRQHQFQKVEMFKFTRREQSYDELESLVRSAETVLQKLGLHYRVMLLCTADMGFASAKTYDIEVWLPSTNDFMEISSCSNTEAFQARRSGIRFKPRGGKKSEFVQTLNGSGLAVGRTWIALVENFQQADGSVVIPEALRPYMGVDRIATETQRR